MNKTTANYKEKTMRYYEHTGRHQELAKQLEKKIPEMGAVANPEGNPKLERYRKAANAYHDLFNNGGMYPGPKTAYFFPKAISAFKDYRYSHMEQLENVYAITEPIMDKIILRAAYEQGLIGYPAASARETTNDI
jgi:hypothetical protein